MFILKKEMKEFDEMLEGMTADEVLDMLIGNGYKPDKTEDNDNPSLTKLKSFRHKIEDMPFEELVDLLKEYGIKTKQINKDMSNYIKITHRQAIGLFNSPILGYEIFLDINNELIGARLNNNFDIKLEKDITLCMNGLEELAYDTNVISWLRLAQYDVYVRKNSYQLKDWIEKYCEV